MASRKKPDDHKMTDIIRNLPKLLTVQEPRLAKRYPDVVTSFTANLIDGGIEIQQFGGGQVRMTRLDMDAIVTLRDWLTRHIEHHQETK